MEQNRTIMDHKSSPVRAVRGSFTQKDVQGGTEHSKAWPLTADRRGRWVGGGEGGGAGGSVSDASRKCFGLHRLGWCFKGVCRLLAFEGVCSFVVFWLVFIRSERFGSVCAI